MLRLPLDKLWATDAETLARVTTSIRETDPTAMPARAGPPPVVQQGALAIIPVKGVLTKTPDVFTALFGETTYREIGKAVQRAVADDTVGKILLVIDSPGGSADGLAELGDELLEARAAKPIYAHVDGLAASAGYYLASQATQIFAGRMDMVGSIGVRLLFYDYSKLFENEGIEAVPIDTGEFKSAGAQGTEITESQRDYFQGIVDQYFDDFKAVVRRGRDMGAAQVDAVADGRVFLAKEAKALGLIDKIQPLAVTVGALSKAKGTPRRTRAEMRMRLTNART